MLPFQTAFAAEVDEITDWLLRDAEVVDELGLVLREELGNGLQFDDEAVENEKVGDVTPFEFAAPIKAPQFLLRGKRIPRSSSSISKHSW